MDCQNELCYTNADIQMRNFEWNLVDMVTKRGVSYAGGLSSRAQGNQEGRLLCRWSFIRGAR